MVNRVLIGAVIKTAITGLLLLSPVLATAQNPASPEINSLLKQVRAHAVLAADDASTLESYTFSKTTPQSHAFRLNEIREHANDLVKEFNKLGALRSSGSPWQQEAIDQIQPLLQSMSTRLTATIAHFNENRGRIGMPPYREYVKANREVMTKAARLISDFVDYGETKAQADAFGEALQLPATARQNP